MAETFVQQNEPLLGTSTLRGILLLGGVGLAGYFAYAWWRKQQALEASRPSVAKTVKIPINMPTIKKKKKKK